MADHVNHNRPCEPQHHTHQPLAEHILNFYCYLHLYMSVDLLLGPDLCFQASVDGVKETQNMIAGLIG